MEVTQARRNAPHSASGIFPAENMSGRGVSDVQCAPLRRRRPPEYRKLFSKQLYAANLLLLLLLLARLHISVQGCALSDHAVDCLALLGLSDAWGTWSDVQDDGSSYCTWRGVQCTLTQEGGVSTQRVAGISLNNQGLAGVVPASLAQLTSLQFMQLSDNKLRGALPYSLSRLTSLTVLSMSNNQLSGGIPPSLGNLTLLRILALDSNRLVGSVPVTVGQLKSLEYLNFSTNALAGSIPATIGQLAQLQHLDLSRNAFVDAIPRELGQLSALQVLLQAGYKQATSTLHLPYTYRTSTLQAG